MTSIESFYDLETAFAAASAARTKARETNPQVRRSPKHQRIAKVPVTSIEVFSADSKAARDYADSLASLSVAVGSLDWDFYYGYGQWVRSWFKDVELPEGTKIKTDYDYDRFPECFPDVDGENVFDKSASDKGLILGYLVHAGRFGSVKDLPEPSVKSPHILTKV